jgi:uncharacterized protein
MPITRPIVTSGMTSGSAAALERPIREDERIPLLDAVRGVALGGILLANLMSFFGTDMLSASERRAMPGGVMGEHVLFAINWLVEGKFYSIFSMLLGIGFVLQWARATRRGAAAEQFASFFRRRMMTLIGIGLLHMYGLWAGDILTLYGVIGLLLPTLWRLSLWARTALMLALFMVPLLTHTVALTTEGAADPRAPFAAVSAGVRNAFGIADRPPLDVFARGTAADYWAWNTSVAVARPGTYLQSGRPAKVLALFLLGAWLGSTVLPRLAQLRTALLIAAVLGEIVGLGASYVYASIKAATGSTFLLSADGLLQTAAYTLGTTPLALAYLALAALAWDAPRTRALLEWFTPLGRMALSVYLAQTLLQLAIFSSFGLRLAGRVSVAWLPAFAVAILLVQRYVCAAWLRRHEQGPVERVWRRVSYGAELSSR